MGSGPAQKQGGLSSRPSKFLPLIQDLSRRAEFSVSLRGRQASPWLVVQNTPVHMTDVSHHTKTAQTFFLFFSPVQATLNLQPYKGAL